MAEVYSISGAEGFGAAACPVGWEGTPHGNCGAPVAGCPTNMQYGGACRSPAAVQLQNALVALGQVAGDPVLKALQIDGFIGPLTTDAVNRAFTMHIGAGQAPAGFRTGTLTMADVAAAVMPYMQTVAAEVARRGAVVPAARSFKANVPATPREASASSMVEPLGTENLPKSAWFLVAGVAAASVAGFWDAWKAGRRAGGGASVYRMHRYRRAA